LTIKQVVMNSNVCSKCAKVSSSTPAGSSTTVNSYKNYIKLNSDAMVAAELKNQDYQENLPSRSATSFQAYRSLAIQFPPRKGVTGASLVNHADSRLLVNDLSSPPLDPR